MSPHRNRYTVELSVGRKLTADIDAVSPEIALAIAEYLFDRHGAQPFARGDETIVDMEIIDSREAA